MKKIFTLAALAIAIAYGATKDKWPTSVNKWPSWPVFESKFPKFPAEPKFPKFPSWPTEPVDSWTAC